jgi:hypothetical protein
MSLEIINVVNSEDVNAEFVRLKVIKDVNLKDYAIIDNTYTEDGNISNIHRHIYRFPDVLVAKGNFVRLYSGVGKNKKQLPNEKNKHTVHFFYWGSKSCIWNNRTGDVVELVKIQSIAREDISEPESE